MLQPCRGMLEMFCRVQKLRLIVRSWLGFGFCPRFGVCGLLRLHRRRPAGSMALEFERPQCCLVPTSDRRKANMRGSRRLTPHPFPARDPLPQRRALLPLLHKRTQRICPRIVHSLEIDSVWNQNDGYLCSVRIGGGLDVPERLFKPRDIHTVVIVVARIGAQPPPIQP